MAFQTNVWFWSRKETSTVQEQNLGLSVLDDDEDVAVERRFVHSTASHDCAVRIVDLTKVHIYVLYSETQSFWNLHLNLCLLYNVDNNAISRKRKTYAVLQFNSKQILCFVVCCNRIMWKLENFIEFLLDWIEHRY